MNEVALSDYRIANLHHIKIASQSLCDQSKALAQIAQRLDTRFVIAVESILNCRGRTVVSGLGKSGLVGKKMAATFSSTGTPSFFMHPTEAYHGDLGMLTSAELVILISYSGETEELIRLIPVLKNFSNAIIVITGNSRSTLAKHADVTLDVAVEREICPNNLAPTTSTLATMAMGDALAVALMKARDFKSMDFALFHPGGSLGRRLHTRVRDVMRRENLPFLSPQTKVHEAIFTMTSGRLGLGIIVENGLLAGVITDGDLRRAMLKDSDMMNKPVERFMSTKPVTIKSNVLVSDAENIMREKKISALIVVGDRGANAEADDICGVMEIYDDSPRRSVDT